jgi:hypothetical protein
VCAVAHNISATIRFKYHCCKMIAVSFSDVLSIPSTERKG